MNSYPIFRVIKIIDEYSIVINGGLDDDLSIGDKIEIFIEGDEIVDPFDNNKNLGTLDFIKETLSVSEVYPKFSVCNREIERKRYIPSAVEQALRSPFANFQGKTEVEHIIEPLNINEDEKSGRMSGDKKISIGDTARQAITE